MGRATASRRPSRASSASRPRMASAGGQVDVGRGSQVQDDGLRVRTFLDGCRGYAPAGRSTFAKNIGPANRRLTTPATRRASGLRPRSRQDPSGTRPSSTICGEAARRTMFRAASRTAIPTPTSVPYRMTLVIAINAMIASLGLSRQILRDGSDVDQAEHGDQDHPTQRRDRQVRQWRRSRARGRPRPRPQRPVRSSATWSPHPRRRPFATGWNSPGSRRSTHRPRRPPPGPRVPGSHPSDRRALPRRSGRSPRCRRSSGSRGRGPPGAGRAARSATPAGCPPAAGRPAPGRGPGRPPPGGPANALSPRATSMDSNAHGMRGARWRPSSIVTTTPSPISSEASSAPDPRTAIPTASVTATGFDDSQSIRDSTPRPSATAGPPRIFSTWPKATTQPDARHVAHQDGPRQEVGEEAHPSEPHRHEDARDQQAEGPGQADPVVARDRQGRDRRRDQRGGRCIRPDDQPPAGPEDRVRDERRQRRVEPDLGRQPGDPGVPDAERHDQGGDRQARRRRRRRSGPVGSPAGSRRSAVRRDPRSRVGPRSSRARIVLTRRSRAHSGGGSARDAG